MILTSIDNPYYDGQEIAGFTRAQFQKLDSLYLRASQVRAINARAVDCDFDQGVATFTYARNDQHPPMFQFVIRKIGPGKLMYEFHQEKSWQIFKSSIFDRVYEKLEQAVVDLMCHSA